MQTIQTSTDATAAENGLAPEARKIVDLLASLKPFTEGTPEEARLLRESRKNPLALEPRALAKIEDMVIQGSEAALPARFYRPFASHSNPLPALVYFHGGGFVLGSIDTHDTIVQNLAAESGAIVVSVGYRLSPETKFPGAVQDAFDSFHWIRQHASDLGIDPLKLAIGGDSAGANLAAVTCLRNRDLGKANAVFQLLLYPVTDMQTVRASKRAYAQGYFLDIASMKWFNRHYLAAPDQAAHPLASPLLVSDHSNLPPLHVMTAGFDPLRDEGKAYADKLKAAGVPSTHTCYTDMFHGFLSFGKGLVQAQAAISEIGRILQQALYGAFTK